MQLGGCGLFGVGVWLSFTQAEFSSLPLSFPSLSAANLLLVAGGVTMVTGFLGCLGALKEQRCLLMTVINTATNQHATTPTPEVSEGLDSGRGHKIRSGMLSCLERGV